MGSETSASQTHCKELECERCAADSSSHRSLLGGIWIEMVFRHCTAVVLRTCTLAECRQIYFSARETSDRTSTRL
eukprot:2046642-Prymnesium_polylepis.1